MKPKRIFKIVLYIIVIAFGVYSFNSYGKTKPKLTVNSSHYIKQEETDISITIDKNTSEKDLSNIKKMLQKNGIFADFSEIKRDDSGSLTSIKIELKNNEGNKAVGQITSNFPIKKITFGRKKGVLYVGENNNNLNMFALINNNMFSSQVDLDSIFSKNKFTFKQFNLNDIFNNNISNLNRLQEQMEIFFKSNNINDPFALILNNTNDTPKYNFKDNSNKLIIINGKESNFETLNKLVKENKIESVDILQSKTAISIYGKKAKYGAIIAVSKN